MCVYKGEYLRVSCVCMSLCISTNVRECVLYVCWRFVSVNVREKMWHYHWHYHWHHHSWHVYIACINVDSLTHVNLYHCSSGTTLLVLFSYLHSFIHLLRDNNFVCDNKYNIMKSLPHLPILGRDLWWLFWMTTQQNPHWQHTQSLVCVANYSLDNSPSRKRHTGIISGSAKGVDFSWC